MGVEAPDMPPILERRRGRLKARPAGAQHVAMTVYESSPHGARGRYSPGHWEGTRGEVNDELDGFVHVHTAGDFFTGGTHGHVSDLVVASGVEGRGVGRALMAAAEGWARERGYRLLTLNVFGDNRRALELYTRLGYQPDTTKLVKVLG